MTTGRPERRATTPRAVAATGSQAALAAVGLQLALVTGSSTAVAASYCVVCESPAVSYRCVVDDAGLANPAADRLLCIRDIARGGNHTSCSVENTSAATCSGTDWLLKRPGQGAELGPRANEEDGAVSTVPLAPQAGAASPDAPSAGAGADGPSKLSTAIKSTAEASEKAIEKAGKSVGNAAKSASEAVESAADKTGDAIKSSGSAVGTAASKAWRCLSSLFSDC